MNQPDGGTGASSLAPVSQVLYASPLDRNSLSSSSLGASQVTQPPASDRPLSDLLGPAPPYSIPINVPAAAMSNGVGNNTFTLTLTFGSGGSSAAPAVAAPISAGSLTTTNGFGTSAMDVVASPPRAAARALGYTAPSLPSPTSPAMLPVSPDASSGFDSGLLDQSASRFGSSMPDHSSSPMDVDAVDGSQSSAPVPAEPRRRGILKVQGPPAANPARLVNFTAIQQFAFKVMQSCTAVLTGPGTADDPFVQNLLECLKEGEQKMASDASRPASGSKAVTGRKRARFSLDKDVGGASAEAKSEARRMDVDGPAAKRASNGLGAGSGSQLADLAYENEGGLSPPDHDQSDQAQPSDPSAHPSAPAGLPLIAIARLIDQNLSRFLKVYTPDRVVLEPASSARLTLDAVPLPALPAALISSTQLLQFLGSIVPPARAALIPVMTERKKPQVSKMVNIKKLVPECEKLTALGASVCSVYRSLMLPALEALSRDAPEPAASSSQSNRSAEPSMDLARLLDFQSDLQHAPTDMLMLTSAAHVSSCFSAAMQQGNGSSSSSLSPATGQSSREMLEGFLEYLCRVLQPFQGFVLFADAAEWTQWINLLHKESVPAQRESTEESVGLGLRAIQLAKSMQVMQHDLEQVGQLVKRWIG